MIRLLVCLLFLLGLYSCVPFKKRIYLQDGRVTADTILKPKYQYKLQVNDRLNIRVFSMNEKITEFFNLNVRSGQGSGGSGGQNQGNLNNYIIDSEGNVEIPMLGKVYVEGITVEEASDTISVLIREMVTDAYIICRLAEYNVVVIGDSQEQIISFTDDRVNIFEIIASSGLDKYSNKKEVEILRNQNGNLTLATVDLTQKDIITSDYYYLQPNDVVHIKPLKAKVFLDNLGMVIKVLGVTSLVYFAQRLITTL